MEVPRKATKGAWGAMLDAHESPWACRIIESFHEHALKVYESPMAVVPWTPMKCSEVQWNFPWACAKNKHDRPDEVQRGVKYVRRYQAPSVTVLGGTQG